MTLKMAGHKAARALAIMATAMVFGLDSSAAQDVLTTAPEFYKKVIENARIRVLEANLKPGAKIALHSHPEHLMYLLTDGTLVIKQQGRTPYEMTFKAGDAFVLPAQTLATENNGDKAVRALVVELKASAAAPPRAKSRGRRSGKRGR